MILKTENKNLSFDLFFVLGINVGALVLVVL